MIAFVRRIAYLGLLTALAGCAALAPLLSQPTPAPVSPTSSTPQPSPLMTPTATLSPGPQILRIWLPPRFDPSADTPAAQLLNQRLQEFESAHPGLQLDVRIKAEAGNASLLEALTLAGAAAPSVLPDLIALPHADMELAVNKGLLHPMDGLSTLLDDPNWYPYARELGHVQGIGYGLTFAGDALVFLHRPDLELSTWEAVFALKEPLSFAAGDERALVLLSLYVSAGGRFITEQGRPMLEEAPLTQTLSFLQAGLTTNTFTPSLLDLKTDEDVFQLYRDGRARMVIAWSAQKNLPIDTIPPLNAPHTFADGWMWSLAGAAPEKQQVATELAEFLMEAEFLRRWTESAGYLPTRITQDTPERSVLESAQAIPPQEVLSVLGPVLEEALKRVWGGEAVPGVVRSVMEQVQ